MASEPTTNYFKRLGQVLKVRLPAYFLPCMSCQHLCAIDASSCPSCGTRRVFPIPGRVRAFFTSILLFLFAGLCWLGEASAAAKGQIFWEVMLSLVFVLSLLFGFAATLLLFFRIHLLKLIAKFQVVSPISDLWSGLR